MANPEHLKILEQGVKVWNAWREENAYTQPDLKEAALEGINLIDANLSESDLTRANLNGADLSGSNLYRSNLSWVEARGIHLNRVNLTEAKLFLANLIHADLSGANLQQAKLDGSYLRGATLIGTNLTGASLDDTNLTRAVLNAVILRKATLSGANLTGISLLETDFRDTELHETVFNDVDLSTTKHLEQCRHLGPSILDHRTLAKSGSLPLPFLRGCGLSDKYIEYIPSLFHDTVIQFYSCFISYSSKDEEFAKRLHADLQGAGVRCWFAPEDIKGGEKIYEQIDTAIRIHDKLLLVLSEQSITSEWVKTELRRCLKAEKKENRRKLFPLRLMAFDSLQNWECFDSDHGKDLAVEVREYFIPDFSNWKDHDSYKTAFDRLLRDLKESDSA